MEKVFNWFALVFGIIGGGLINLLGGSDVLLQTITAFVILDYITGIVKAVYTKQLSSQIGFKGICKKVMIYLVIAFAVFLEKIIKIPIREITIMFFLANEGISLLENAAEVIPVPQKLKETLLQIRDNEQEEK